MTLGTFRLTTSTPLQVFMALTQRQVRVTFTPKPRKADYTKAKAYHPISLLSILLNMTVKLVDRHIRDWALKPPCLTNW
jgi:hypothetical protein